MVEVMDDRVEEPTTLRQVLEQDRVELVECDCAPRSLTNKTVAVCLPLEGWVTSHASSCKPRSGKYLVKLRDHFPTAQMEILLRSNDLVHCLSDVGLDLDHKSTVCMWALVREVGARSKTWRGCGRCCGSRCGCCLRKCQIQ